MTLLATAIADLPRPIAENRTVDGSVELAHLQFLLERQSSCLMRVGTDGVLLAVNEAALSLLAGMDLSAVLGTTLPERIVPEQQSSWNEFSVRVWSDGSGSHECNIVGPTSSSRSVMLQGLALPGHPDGIPSMLLTLRDVSATRRLEAALQEHTIVLQTADRLRNDLDLAVAEQRRLTALLADKEVEVQQVLLAHTAERNALVGLKATLEQAETDRRAVAQVLADAQVEHQRIQAETMQWASERAEVKEQENHAAQAALRAEVERGALESRQLESRLAGTAKAYEQFTAAQRQRETNLQQLLAESVTARSDAERALTEATMENTRLARTVADLTVDQKQLDENAREIEWLAGAGRLAVDLARELQNVTTVIEAGAKTLLENGPVEGPERDQIEKIRGGALRVASLARQMAVSERSA